VLRPNAPSFMARRTSFAIAVRSFLDGFFFEPTPASLRTLAWPTSAPTLTRGSLSSTPFK
jgi:hypothetical protein